MNKSTMHRVTQQYWVTSLPKNPVVAMAYAPFQITNNVYSAEQGMTLGMMSHKLNKSFGAVARGEKNE